MKFGTGSTTELTQKYGRVKVQNDIHKCPNIYTNNIPNFHCVTPESFSLTLLCSPMIMMMMIMMVNITFNFLFLCGVGSHK